MIYKQMVEDNTVRELQAGRAAGGQISTYPAEAGGEGRELEGTSTQWGTSFLD